MRGDDLIGSKGLSRINERGQNLTALLTFRCGWVYTSVAALPQCEDRLGNLHAIDDGRGLLIPILADGSFEFGEKGIGREVVRLSGIAEPYSVGDVLVGYLGGCSNEGDCSATAG